MGIKETKAIWDILRSLADELEKRFAPVSPVIKKLTVDPINKPDNDGKHKRDFKIKIQYGKAAADVKMSSAVGIDSSLELEHRDDCPWTDPQP